MSGSKLSQILREPLFHFLLIGAAIFALYEYFAPAEEQEQERTVVVTSGEIQAMADTWKRLWNRPPTEEELAGAIQQHGGEVILYREALAMGLDQDDVVIRRRLKQKVEFLSQDLMVPPDPTEEQERQWFEKHIDNYADPDLYTITHIFFDPDKGDDTILQQAQALRDELNALDAMPEDITGYGDRFMLQNYYPGRTELELRKLFGSGFVDSLMKLEPGQWHGPVLSGYGVHVVVVNSISPSPPPGFDAAREQVRQDWIDAERERLNNQFIDALLARYEVIVEETPVAVIGAGGGATR